MTSKELDEMALLRVIDPSLDPTYWYSRSDAERRTWLASRLDKIANSDGPSARDKQAAQRLADHIRGGRFETRTN
jgi:hypothetical protein